MEKCKVRCLQDVVMDTTNEIAFLKGDIYEARKNALEVEAIDLQGDWHGVKYLFSENDIDEFWEEYFKLVEEI